MKTVWKAPIRPQGEEGGRAALSSGPPPLVSSAERRGYCSSTWSCRAPAICWDKGGEGRGRGESERGKGEKAELCNDDTSGNFWNASKRIKKDTPNSKEIETVQGEG